VLRIVLIVAAAAALAGCASSNRDESKTQVVATFYPLAFAAEEIAGPAVQVTDLVPAGVEPHDYELTPDDAKAIQGADVIFYLGGRFQPAVEDALASAPGKKIDLLEGVQSRTSDPHVWLDPDRYAQMAERMGDALGEPAGAAAFSARLAELEHEFEVGLADCDRRWVYSSHSAFGYLGRAFGLRTKGLVGSEPAGEIPPKALGTLAGFAERKGATTVFTEPLVPRDVAESFAREVGGLEVATLDPIESAAEGQDYFSLMRGNLAALRKGLGCR
jgi:zinc transport system substrate-binding protein